MSSSYLQEIQPPRGKQTLSTNLDNVSTTATAGGDTPTVESLRDSTDPPSHRDSQASPASSEVGDSSQSDKLKGKAQKIAGKASRNTELDEKGETRESEK